MEQALKSDLQSNAREQHFVWVKHKQTYYVSVYLTSSQSISEYQAGLEGLEDAD